MIEFIPKINEAWQSKSDEMNKAADQITNSLKISTVSNEKVELTNEVY